ncbi:putative transposase [Shigella flexneri 2850-71]|nr:putative transposase [Shigella flexneri 2850-71]
MKLNRAMAIRYRMQEIAEKRMYCGMTETQTLSDGPDGQFIFKS